MKERNGFCAYIVQPPPPNALVRFWHELSGQVWTGSASELNPCYNVAYVWWKLSGIEHERLAEGKAA